MPRLKSIFSESETPSERRISAIVPRVRSCHAADDLALLKYDRAGEIKERMGSNKASSRLLGKCL